MKVIKNKVGNTEINIQLMDDNFELLAKQGERTTTPTSVAEKLDSIYDDIQSTIKSIASEMGEKLRTINSKHKPKEVELEFQLGVSAEVGTVLVVSGKGEYTMTVRMTWDLSKDEK